MFSPCDGQEGRRRTIGVTMSATTTAADMLSAALIAGDDDAAVKAYGQLPPKEQERLATLSKPIRERWVAAQALEACRVAGMPVRPIGKAGSGYYVAVKDENDVSRVAITVTL